MRILTKIKIAIVVGAVITAAAAYRYVPRPPASTAGQWHPGHYIVVGFKVTPPHASLTIDGAVFYGTQPKNGVMRVEVPDISKKILLEARHFILGAAYVVLAREYSTDGKEFQFRDKTPLHIQLSYPGYKPWTTDIVPDDNILEVSAKLERAAP